ncbi:MAG: SH3 domain-containing protein [Aggregatilineales bacterium]
MRKFLILIMLVVLFVLNLPAAFGQSEVRARVIAYELNLRDSYHDESQIVGMLSVNTEVVVLAREDEPGNGGIWMQVRTLDGGASGWVLSVYLEFAPDFILQSIPVVNIAAPAQNLTTENAGAEQPVQQQSAAPVATGQGISGSTRAIVNLRGGPGTNFDVISTVQAGQTVVFVGRNQSSTWLQTLVSGGTMGWLSYTFVNVDGNVTNLPVVGAGAPLPQTQTTTAEQAPQNTQANAMPGVIPSISGTARQIYLRGQQLGNNAGVFAKIGDSITASNLFLNPVGFGGARLNEYAYLQPVIDFFSQTSARDHFSFANTSLAARGGWTSFDVLDPQRAVPGICNYGESPLVCEYRNNRPSVALIMLGTNDLNWVNGTDYRANLERIVQTSIDMGVIPVLSTIPDQPLSYAAGRVSEFNGIIMAVAAQYDIPLWNYWSALQGLPNRGLSGDSVHPSYDSSTAETAIFDANGLRFGYNVRNLTALMVLDAVWRGAMY